MPDFGKRASGGESLDAITYTDQLLDALATERRVQPGDAGDAALFSLLESWRDDVRFPTSAHVLTEQDATAALRDGLSVRPAKRGGHRGLTIVASLAAAVLCVGGFGAVVGTAGPGDPLYGMRTALFGEGPEVRDDQVALASAQMAQVQQLISQGDWEQAQQKLQAVSTQVQAVDDVGTKTDLIQQWNELSVKVGTRDPAATLPPVEPGAPPVEPPPGVTLLELPPITTTTAPSSDVSTPPSDATSTTLTTSETAPTSESSTTAPSESSVPPSSTAPTTTELPTTTTAVEAPAPVTSSTTPSTTAPPTTTTSAAAEVPPPTTTTAAVTTTTAAASSSTAPTTTSVAPSSSSQAPQVVTTTTAPAAASPAPESSSVAVTTTTAAPRAEVSPAPQLPAETQSVPERAPEVVTTTVLRPLLPAEG
ncbi:MAG: anti-sigma-D factor RsdA [Mycobacterium sp.]